MNRFYAYISPLIWLAGLSPVFPLMAGFYFGAKAANRRYFNTKAFNPALAFFIYSLIYLFSILWNSGLSLDERVLGGFYNLSIMIMSIPIILGMQSIMVKTSGALNGIHASDAYVNLLVGMCIIAIPLMIFLSSDRLVEFPSVIGSFVDTASLPPLARDSINLLLVAPDWGGDDVTGRLTILAPYANALAGLVVVMLGMTYKSSITRIILACIAAEVLVLLTRSRIGILACTTLVFLYLSIISYHSNRLFFLLISFGVFSFGLLFFVFYISNLDDLLISRDASNELRGLLYAESISRAIEGSPLFGLGLKPRLEAFGMPLGSHSAFIGAFYKTGMLGFFFFVGGFLFLFKSAISVIIFSLNRRNFKEVAPSIALICLLPFFAFEDIDAPQLLFVNFFVMAGVVLYQDGVRSK